MSKPSLDERLDSLGKAIEAARAELDGREAFETEEAGDVLAAINREVAAVTHDDDAGAHAAYDRIEYRLGELQEMLGALPR